MSDTLTLLRDRPATRTPPVVLPAPRRRRRRWPVWGVGVSVGAIVFAAALITVILGGGLEPGCGQPALPGSYTGPGSLGGVAGTGVSAGELAAARAIPGVGGTRIAPGVYFPTAYFPNPNAPATNCASSGSCLSTASGIRVNDATRRAYLIASNPQLNQYGALAYIWPNPYGWNGPFVVADTGGAFQGAGRLDFYIFIDTGQTWQQALAKAYEWGPAQQVRVSSTPIVAGGPSIAAAGGGGCAVPVSGPLGSKVAQVAQRYLGDGPSIPAFIPPSTSLEWCAWFASNVWRLAGVAITTTYASEDLYTWGQAHHTVWKADGQPLPGPTPPLGSAVEFGSGPQSTSTSQHVALVTRINPDGSFMMIGGNEAGGLVDLNGPCRLSRAPAAYLTGPGCDTREVYGIAAP